MFCNWLGCIFSELSYETVDSKGEELQRSFEENNILNTRNFSLNIVVLSLSFLYILLSDDVSDSLIFCAVVGLFKNSDCGQIRSSVYCESRFHREGKNFFDGRFFGHYIFACSVYEFVGIFCRQ